MSRAEGMPIKAIARRLMVSKNTVKRALAAGEPPSYRRESKGSIVDDVDPQIRALLADFPNLPTTVIAEATALFAKGAQPAGVAAQWGRRGGPGARAERLQCERRPLVWRSASQASLPAVGLRPPTCRSQSWDARAAKVSTAIPAVRFETARMLRLCEATALCRNEPVGGGRHRRNLH